MDKCILQQSTKDNGQDRGNSEESVPIGEAYVSQGASHAQRRATSTTQETTGAVAVPRERAIREHELFEVTYFHGSGEGATSDEEDFVDEVGNDSTDLDTIFTGGGVKSLTPAQGNVRSNNPETGSIGYSEAEPKDRGKFKRLARLDYGQYSSDRAVQKRFEGRVRDARLLAERLHLTEPEQQFLFNLVEGVQQADNGFSFGRGFTVEQSLVACTSLVIDRHATSFDRRATERDDFDEVMDEYEVDSDKLRNLRKSIRQRVPSLFQG